MESTLSNFYKSIIAGSGATATYLFGEIPLILELLAVLVVIDVATGLIASGYEGKIRSSIGYKGIAKKIYLFLLIAVGHLIDLVIGDGHLVRDTAIYFYMVNELISILENGGRLGVPIPSVFTQAIEVLKGKGGGKK